MASEQGQLWLIEWAEGEHGLGPTRLDDAACSPDEDAM